VMPDQVSDAILLERFVSRREEAAFVALVERHGPRVEGICRRLLHNEHDVEDISQATFFILARKAAGISWRESVGGWLSAVAHRLALGARADYWRQQQRENTFTSLTRGGTANDYGDGAGRLPEKYHPLADPSGESDRRDLGRVLYEELSQLPAKYQEPLLLCDLEGRTHEEAAERLGWPAGSMSRRLARARALLRRRLIHRGVSLAIGFLGFTLVAFGAWSIAHKETRSAVAIRQVMAPLQPLSEDRPEIPSILSRIDGSLDTPDHDQVITLARLAARIATAIENHDPGTNQDVWQTYAIEMRLSAGLLALATHENNRPDMILAARRLNASCLNCHDLFRKSRSTLLMETPPIPGIGTAPL
jgi:RNA polymerase sigma factor (sigma-70 family)